MYESMTTIQFYYLKQNSFYLWAYNQKITNSGFKSLKISLDSEAYSESCQSSKMELLAKCESR